MGPDEAQAWLDREDSACRDRRLARLRWLAEITPQAEVWLFPGGAIAKYLFEESRHCFVYGQFLAAVLLGMAYIEQPWPPSYTLPGGRILSEPAFQPCSANQ